MGEQEKEKGNGSDVLHSATEITWNLVLLTVGSVLCAVAVNGILVPQHFLSSGFTGVALLIHYFFPPLSVGWAYLLLNIPIFIIGWSIVGRRFFVYSVIGMAIFSLALFTVTITVPIHDKILSALLAGIVNGVGSGIVLRSLGSAGGTDILSVILQKLFSIKLGTTVLFFNGIMLGFAATMFSLEGALYTLVYLYVNTQVLNVVVMGLSKRKVVFIISDRWEKLSEEILKKNRRGVTIIEGIGGYKREDKRILYSVIAFQDLPILKKMVSKIDPNAFVVVMDTLEVMGARIGNQPHW
ncbi:MAG TPA: YitT family protein [Deltaproteobacteria bacterium]|nr:YitT family protein [Deltaproteobacteria bacterium]HPJ93612.1 YitT family protein [Deltaproteobacteria bacterium]HPR50985.1 YitT family protein [Deltaproteobacteria bacterium]